MADLQDLLSSISDEDMAKIKTVADSLMNGGKETEKKLPKLSDGIFDDNSMGKMMSVMSRLNREDDRTRLISDLKPLLSAERQKKPTTR